MIRILLSRITSSYFPNSDLLDQLTTNQGLIVTRAYDPQHDLLTQVKNQLGAEVLSQYDYESDELRCRTDMTPSGAAFEGLPTPVVMPGTTTYTTNGLNQYNSIQEPGTSIQLAYDLDGNLTNDGKFL